MTERLTSGTISDSHGGMYVPSGEPRNQEFDVFLRGVADRLERIAGDSCINPGGLGRELRDIARECRVKIGM